MIKYARGRSPENDNSFGFMIRIGYAENENQHRR